MVATAFELPAVEDGDEVELAAWLVAVGDSVTEGQPIAEVETEKSVIEIDAPFDGTVSELLVEEWTAVDVGEEIAIFEVEEAALDTDADSDPAADSESTTDDGDDATSDQPSEIETPEGRIFAPPRVRRLARELGVDITAVEGSDEHGRITEQDVREAADSGEKKVDDDTARKPFTPSGKSAVSKGGESVSGAGLSKESDDDTGPKPFTPSGKSAVSKRSEAVSGAGGTTEGDTGGPAAQFVAYDTATVDRLVDLTATLGPDAEAQGVELEPLAIVVKTLSRAIETAEIGIDNVDIGLGVRTDDGLSVLVIQDVNEKSLLAVAEETADRVKQVESNAFDAPTNTEVTALITEPGAFGDGYSTPPLGGAAIAVGLGAIDARPVVEDGAVVARETLPVSLVVESETVAPTEATATMRRLLEVLEQPNRLLLESR